MACDLERDDTNKRDSFGATFQSPTFDKDGSFHVNEAVGSASISPGGRDVVLASRQGLHIIDLDNPYSPPRFLPHRTPWEVADVQWSPFASRDYWIASTSNQKALIWNLELSTQIPIEHVLHAHSRAITDINFSAHEPDILATCAVDSFIYCWDLRQPSTPVISFAEWVSGATQVKWNRQDTNILASSHDSALYVWDRRNSAHPLRTIDAHKTKIYGIDWSRVEATQLLTCSSDKTIKLWDYEAQIDTPARVIKASYPVWRARHTPFGFGVLAMPQRGNNELHLYDQRSAQWEGEESIAEPLHSFTGHVDQAKEFLWRVRHGVEEGKDDRAFQLVSWGADKNLLLHRMDDRLLESVGFRRGRPVDKRFRFTRKGAVYRTFHDDKHVVEIGNQSMVPPMQGLSSMFKPSPKSHIKNITKPFVGRGSPLLEPTLPGMRVYSGEKKLQNAIAWMKGVRIFNSKEDSSSLKDSVSHLTTSSAAPSDFRENLGDEVTYVGDKYKKVAFEEVDIPSRSITISLNGPWGPEDSIVHVKTAVQFPKDYPENSPPHFTVEKTSVISDAAFTKLKLELGALCETYASISRSSLEAMMCYLLGEQTLQESIAWIVETRATLEDSTELRAEESSSDEDDEVIGTHNFTKAGPGSNRLDGLGRATFSADAPIPKGCGALWAENGQLVCFFPSRDDTKSIVGTLDATIRDLQTHTPNLFGAFGRLQGNGLKSKRGRLRSVSDASGSDSDSGSSEVSYSSSGSASSSDLGSERGLGFSPVVRWGAASVKPKHVRSHDESHHSSVKPVPKQGNGIGKTYVTIKNPDDIIPSKRILAAEYIVFGSGPTVCSHNASVATKHGFYELADVWNLIGLILCNDVPLEVMPQPHRKQEILVLARRALVHIKRRDSGLDLLFDKPDTVANPKLKGHVKWGHHPLAGAWLVDLLFEHFENTADVQMLAMLSCVLCEPAASEGASNAMKYLPERELPMALKAPAFSLDYFPSTEVAWSQFHPAPPAALQQKSPNIGLGALGTFGSFNSSNGPWSSDVTQGEGSTPYSNGTSPPLLTRQDSRTSNANLGMSLSSSPERVIRRSNSINAFAASLSLSRTFIFGMSASPPTHRNPPPQLLSSSAPTTNPLANGITWSRNRGNEDAGSVRFAEPHQSAIYDEDYSDTEPDFSVNDDDEVTVTLKNQAMFDDEACFSAPLLKPEDASKHRAYREAYATLLDVWSLPQMRCEILKFNGLVSYFPAPLSLPPNEAVLALGKAPPTDPSAAAANGPSSQWDSHRGLGIAGYCSGCGEPALLLPSTHLNTGAGVARCASCQKAQSKVLCYICFEAVRGLYRPCLGCGHVVHAECQSLWLAEVGRVGGVGDGESAECETGCGCRCSEHWVVDAVELVGGALGAEEEEEVEHTDSLLGEVGTEAETETTVLWDWEGWDGVG